MSKVNTVKDEWVLPILRELIPPRALSDLQAQQPSSYWSAAVAATLVTDAQLLDAIAARTRLRVAAQLHSAHSARDQVPERIARRYGVLPLTLSETTLEVATGNPYDLECEQTLAFVSGKQIRLTLASPTRIAEKIDEVYPQEQSVAKLLANVQTSFGLAEVRQSVVRESPDALTTVPAGSALDRPMIQLVDHIVAQGIARHASDIHLEAEEGGIAVRYRIDGALRHDMVLPKGIGIPLVSRIKIIARMDIADRLRPQGGRARVSLDGTPIDLRVSTLPSAHGEKVVIRILDPRAATISLDTLGLDARATTRLRTLLDTREGLILVTGPTGSGKTTTLYAALQTLLKRGVNIITVEDPVEYRIPGIVQVQVNAKAGLTFAEALRSILRQDPDVVLIGEVRDRETATIAIQAALTGHLVFATLHTIDACSSIARLTDLGVEPPRIAAALKGVIAQRLVRRLCPTCATPSSEPTPAILWNEIPTGATLLQSMGCDRCHTTGYKGRFAVTELLLTSPTLARQISSNAPIRDLIATARRTGASSLWSNGVARLLTYETTIDELLRVLEPDQYVGADENDFSHPPPHQSMDRDNSIDASTEWRYDIRDAPSTAAAKPAVTDVTVGVVDVYVIDPSCAPWHVLALQRAPDTRCPGSWEAIHGRIEPDERPETTAIRELREETGLEPQRLYNVTAHAFYLHQTNVVQIAVVFCAFVDSTHPLTLGSEHVTAEWIEIDAAAERFTWPRATQMLAEIRKLLGTGNAGTVEDVLRVL